MKTWFMSSSARSRSKGSFLKSVSCDFQWQHFSVAVVAFVAVCGERCCVIWYGVSTFPLFNFAIHD